MRSMVLIRLFGRLLLPRLAALLAPTWLWILFAVVQLDAVVDWGGTAALARALPVGSAVALWSLVCLGWAFEARKAVRRAVLTREMEFLWRQPLSRADWGIALVGPLLFSAGPAFAAGLLLGPAHGWLLASGSAVISLGLAVGGPGLPLAAAGLASVGLGVALTHVVPTTAVVVAAGATGAAVAALGHLGLRARPIGDAGVRSLAPRLPGPLTALSWRDLLCTWRTERAAVLACLFVSAPAWAVQSAAQVNGPLLGESATLAALVILGTLSSVAASVAGAMCYRLGPFLDPPQTPVTPAQRATTLVASASALGAPLVAGLLVAGTGTPAGPARVVLLAVALAAGAVALAGSQGPPARRAHMTGSWLWWMMPAVALACLPNPWGALSSALLTSLAWGGLTLSLHRRRTCPPG